MLVASGCVTRTSEQDDRPETRDTRTADAPDREVVGDLEYQAVIDRTVQDLSEFWSEEYPSSFGAPYLGDPTVTGFDSAMPDGGSVSVCAEGYRYPDMPDAFYCPLDDVIAYDDEEFFPDLFREIGPFANALVLAHEWGHAIQHRSLSPAELDSTATVLTETQSDCYAGAWAGSVASSTGDDLAIAPGDLAAGLIGLVQFRDPVGIVDPSGEGAHGSAFDRVSAFQEGFDQGVGRCADWLTDPPAITETPFQDPLDVARGGNAPYSATIDFTTTTLDAYWSSAVDGFEPPDVVPFDPDVRATLEPCSSLDLDPQEPADYRDHVYFCPDDGTVRFDEDLLRRVHRRYGDFAAAVLLAKAYAGAVQEQLDLDDGPNASSLHADCLSGAWAGSLPVTLADRSVVAARGGPVATDFGDISLSAGDLDEVVKVMLLLDDASRFDELLSERQRRTAAAEFERVDAFRDGFAGPDPLEACAEHGP
jgi:predicted metalloprotease